jgi:hypothetical protein
MNKRVGRFHLDRAVDIRGQYAEIATKCAWHQLTLVGFFKNVYP